VSRDSTILFESHHLEKSQGLVTKALKEKLTVVGEFVGENEGGDAAFFTLLRRRVHERLRSLQINQHYGTKFILTEMAVCLVLYFASTFAVGLYASYLAAALLGLLTGRMGFLMHSGNHASASSSKAINTFAALCMDLVGASSVVWRYQHQVSHHMYPNDPVRDMDTHSGKPVVRFHPKHPLLSWHKINPLATMLGMSGVTLKWIFSDFYRAFVNPYVANIRVNMSVAEKASMLLFKLQWFALHVALPLYFHGLATTVKLLLVTLSISAYYMSGTFIVNHIQEGLTADPKRHWAERQVLASANWAPGSVFYNWLSGGLNHQIEHHLFPAMSIYVYPYIQDLVEKTCKEHNMPYRTFPSYSNALFHTLKFLYRLGLDKVKV
jgi:fatty acid desaturase